ncbi:MAG: dihydrofolate reductase [Pseudomonadales bacterium]
MIWAMTRNRVIGRDNDLPWHLPLDMKHFMTTTRGHPVIMGRRTFESMDRKPLPRRTNIVVTRTPEYSASDYTASDYPASDYTASGYTASGILVAADLGTALALARRQCQADGVDEAFIIGGARLYEAGLALADRLYVTEIDAVLDGDTFFPEIDWRRWRRVRSEAHPADERHAYPFTIAVFERA